MYEQLALYIDGEFLTGDGRRTQDVVNPATLEVLGQLPHASEADLDRALAAAQRAFETWKRTSPMERAAILRKVGQLSRDRAQEIGRNMTLDQGKPLAEAVGEVASCSGARRLACRRMPPHLRPRDPAAQSGCPPVRGARAHRRMRRVHALELPVQPGHPQDRRRAGRRLHGGAQGAGRFPSAVMAIARMFHEAGLPKGCLNIVWGEPAKISDYLIRSPIVRKVSFTGSVPVGKQLAALAGAHMKRVTMELGGHSPVLVFDDADVDRAAEMLARFKVRNAGQVCVSPTRFYVQNGAYEQFLARFTEVLKNIKVGDGLEKGTDMGPLAHERRVPAMSTFVDDALKHGGKVVLGGDAPDRKGYFFSPTVVTELPDNAMLMTEEPFGPLAPVVRFTDTDEVLRRANSLPFGLSSYVFTNSLKTATKVSNALEAGMVNINHFGSALAETPFGGIKDSGIGSEGGLETFDGYLVTKYITHI